MDLGAEKPLNQTHVLGSVPSDEVRAEWTSSGVAISPQIPHTRMTTLNTSEPMPIVCLKLPSPLRGKYIIPLEILGRFYASDLGCMVIDGKEIKPQLTTAGSCDANAQKSSFFRR
jgi:hypothetical protein